MAWLPFCLSEIAAWTKPQRCSCCASTQKPPWLKNSVVLRLRVLIGCSSHSVCMCKVDSTFLLGPSWCLINCKNKASRLELGLFVPWNLLSTIQHNWNIHLSASAGKNRAGTECAARFAWIVFSVFKFPTFLVFTHKDVNCAHLDWTHGRRRSVLFAWLLENENLATGDSRGMWCGFMQTLSLGNNFVPPIFAPCQCGSGANHQ